MPAFELKREDGSRQRVLEVGYQANEHNRYDLADPHFIYLKNNVSALNNSKISEPLKS